MKKKQNIDGFVSRSDVANINDDNRKSVDRVDNIERLEPSDIEDSLRELNQLDNDNVIQLSDKSKSSLPSRRRLRRDRKIQKKLDKKNQKRLKKGKRPLSVRQFRRRRFFKSFLLILLIVLVGAGGYFGYRLLNSTSKVFSGSIFSVFEGTKLEKDENGRTNILIFGTSQEGWNGSELADSIIVLSIDQTDYSAYTISLPRDLYIKHSCPNFLGTTAGKLNESYVCGKADDDSSPEASEIAGSEALASAATSVTGLNIQYYVHVNWNALIQVVDSIGGIDLTIEVYDGSPEIYDYATQVHYKDGEVVHLNGAQALALSRARGSEGGYGISGGNFDREKNQQKIIKAILAKIKSSNIANVSTLLGIMDALGDNINTNLQMSEISASINMIGKFETDNVKSIPLVDSDNDIQLFVTDNIGGLSVVVPVAGTYDYSDIKTYINKIINPTPITEEAAKLVVINGTNVSSLAAKEQTNLESRGFLVDSIGSVSDYTEETTIYYLSDSKTATSSALSEIYGTEVKTDIPSWVQEYDADFVIVLGSDPSAS